MNDPIISPWVIYLIDLARPVTAITFVFGVLLLLASAVCLLAIADIHDDTEKDTALEMSKKFFIAGCSLALIWALVPSQSTIYKMIAASYITPANIQATGELADKSIDYIGSKADKATDAAVEKIIRIIDAVKKEDKNGVNK